MRECWAWDLRFRRAFATNLLTSHLTVPAPYPFRGHVRHIHRRLVTCSRSSDLGRATLRPSEWASLSLHTKATSPHLQAGVARRLPRAAERHPLARHLPPRADAGRPGRLRALLPGLGA